MKDISPGTASYSNRAPLATISLGQGFAASGNRAEAQKILNELMSLSQRQYVSPYGIAAIYTALGEKEEAFRWLEKAYDEGNTELVFLKVDPRLDSLRTDPRFNDLIKGLGPPQ